MKKTGILWIIACMLVLTSLPGTVAQAEPAKQEQAGKPVQDKPSANVDRVTLVNVQIDGDDSLGARLSMKLKERFNQSNLFTLSSGEKDAPELRLLLSTASEFADRPNVGSVYSVNWVFSQGKGYLSYLLAREVGTVNADNMDALVDKLLEKTDAVAAKYGNLWK